MSVHLCYGSLGLAFLGVGFVEKAKNYYQEALALDGDSAEYFYNLAGIELFTDNFENARLFYEKTMKIDSTYPPALEWISFMGLHQEAYKVAEKCIEQIKNSGDLSLLYSHRIGYAFYKVGKYKEANYFFNEQIKYGTESIKLKRNIARTKQAQYNLAGVYSFLGDKEKAYQYLDEFNTMNFCGLWWISYAKYDVLFDSIRNEGRFQKIIQNLEAKHNAEHERVKKWLEEQGML